MPALCQRTSSPVNRRSRTAEAMIAESGGPPEEESGKEVGSAQQEARTCPVCGTKFYAADSPDSVRFVSCAGLLAGDLRRPGNHVQRQGRQVSLRRLTVGRRFGDSRTMN